MVPVTSSSHSSSLSPGKFSSSIEGNRSAKGAGISSRRPAGASESSENGIVASENKLGGGLDCRGGRRGGLEKGCGLGFAVRAGLSAGRICGGVGNIANEIRRVEVGLSIAIKITEFQRGLVKKFEFIVID